MILQHNVMSMFANQQYKINSDDFSKSTKKLSSGYRINTAADDAAGLSISEKMRAQIRGLRQATRNVEDGISYVQVADGALGEVQTMLHRMNELAVQSANDTNTENDRAALDAETQQLKEQIGSIFKDTSYNTIRLWEPDEDSRVVLGTEMKQVVRVTSGDTRENITQANKDVLPYGSMHINANETDGVSISWKGYNGSDYETKKISWDELKDHDYSFDMADYFDETKTELFKDGSPVFHKTLSLRVLEEATTSDLATALNGKSMSVGEYISAYTYFQNADGTHQSNPSGISTSIALNYNAAYVAAADMDRGDDTFLESKTSVGSGNVSGVSNSSTSSVANAKTSSELWKFAFSMNNIGDVKSTISSIYSYAPSDTEADDENYWWHWTYRGDGSRYQSYNTINAQTKDLAGVMDLLTGTKGSATPGLLTSANGGDADQGGYIVFNYNLTSETPYHRPDGSTSNSIGSFTVSMRVNNTDTEESVLQKLKDAFNTNTIIDPEKQGDSSDYVELYKPYNIDDKIAVPIYGGSKKIQIQAGPIARQSIDITYDTLSLSSLGINNTDIATRDDASQAITDIADALQQVNSQRSIFGSYQNRLEHASQIAANTAENVQSAESLIRDTDMAAEMVSYSKNQILIQVGQSVLAQANSSLKDVVSLLQ